MAGKGQRVEIVFTITTDLGDSFLYPEAPVRLQMILKCAETGAEQTWPSPGNELQWKAGDRTLKLVVPLSSHMARDCAAGQSIDISIRPRSALVTALESEQVASAAGDGLIMPAWATLNQEDRQDVLARSLNIGVAGKPIMFSVDEGIGESIARHIWDAGVVALCSIAVAVLDPSASLAQEPCMEALRQTLAVEQPLNIMELGCGVGILGLGVGALLPQAHPRPRDCFVLMTDLEEARGQAESNIPQLYRMVPLSYENLDWEEGRLGNFGPEVSARQWDLIVLSDCTYNVDMLPVLVETLSALHAARGPVGGGTKVFLATKPRHPSERALFDLMKEHRWETLAEQTVPLPILGQEPETVELYLFQKP